MKSFYFFLLSSLLPIAATGQWTTQTDVNTLVATAQTGDVQSAGTSDGRTYVAYWKDVPAPAYYEMRLQLLDAEGYQQFGPEGMLVNNVVPMSSYTTIWSITVDQEDNVYIGFNGTEGNTPAYVHKISPLGVQLWGPNGVVVGSGFDVKVLPLGNGEAIVSWLPDNLGVFQKFDANGAPVWANPVTIQPLVSGHKTSAGEMAEMSNGDIVILFHDRSGFSIYSLFHAQRYDSNGAPVWAAPVALANASTAFNRRYSIAQDGDVVYLGYSGSVGLVFYSYLQRVNADGTLPWGINGSSFSTGNIYYQRDTEIAFQEGSPFVWAVCEYTTTSQGQIGEYVQKFDKATGARQLTDNAREVFAVNDDHRSHRGALQLVDDQPVFMLSSGWNNGATPVDLIVAYLDGNGDFVWPEQYREIATYEDSKGRFDFTRPFNGQCVGVWTEERPEIGQSRAFAQNIVVVDCPAPNPGFTINALDLVVQFTSTATGADSTAWNFGNGDTASGENATYTYPAEGAYTVCQYVFNDCGVDSLCQELTVVNTGVGENPLAASVSIFPNPGDGAFYLQLSLENPSRVSWELSSLDGRVVAGQDLGNLMQGQSTFVVEAGDLVPGVYYLRVRLDERAAVLPVFVVE